MKHVVSQPNALALELAQLYGRVILICSFSQLDYFLSGGPMLSLRWKS